MSERFRRLVRRMRPGLAAVAACAAAGCATMGLGPERSPGIETEIRDAERRALEDRTRSHLAALEVGLEGYVRGEDKVPAKLDALVPRYLAEVPVVDVGIRAHKPTDEVRYYPSEVIQDDVIDGTRLRDSGRWGYAFNGRRVIVFVDCTHKTTQGELWYQVRGVH